EVTRDYSVIEQSGHTEEIEALYEELKPSGILQFVRSGRVAITKSIEEKVSAFLEEVEARRFGSEEML
ncbi:MAG: acetolactate synthase small subunit, partial [Bacteroidales bacterium]|nr:acetolactate synthase small subunit [Bacteroidales bacterium]